MAAAIRFSPVRRLFHITPSFFRTLVLAPPAGFERFVEDFEDFFVGELVFAFVPPFNPWAFRHPDVFLYSIHPFLKPIFAYFFGSPFPIHDHQPPGPPGPCSPGPPWEEPEPLLPIWDIFIIR